MSEAADRYVIEEELSRSQQARVYRGHDRLEGTPVVVKQTVVDGEGLSQLRKEACLLRLLRLPGIARIRDEWVADGTWSLVTDQAAGAHFPGDAQSASSLRAAWCSVLSTLVWVHRAGITHCDLKPSNVLVSKGTTTLLDFGLSHDRRAQHDSSGFSQWYASPESLKGAAAAPADDVYALAVMVLEAIHPSTPTLPRARVLAARDASVPVEMQSVLAACLSVNRSARPTADEALAALANAPHRGEVLAEDSPFEPTHEELRSLLGGSDEEFANQLADYARLGFGRLTKEGLRWYPEEVATLRLAQRVQQWDVGPALEWCIDAVWDWRRRRDAPALALWCLGRARADGSPDQSRTALEVVCALAIHSESWRDIERALLECERSEDDALACANLLRAALNARFQRRHDAATRWLPDPAGYHTRVLAVAHHVVVFWSEAEPQHADWAQTPEERAIALRLSGLRAYRRGAYADAVAFYHSMEGTRSPADQCNLASSLIELGQANRAVEHLTLAVDEARASRHVTWISHSVWLLRHARYRAGHVLSPRPDLVDHAERANLSVTGVLALNEAAVAWRCGDTGLAAELADRATKAFRIRGRALPELLAASFAASLRSDLELAVALWTRCREHPPGDLVYQALSLLRWSHSEPDIQAWNVRPDSYRDRLDLLTLAEAAALRTSARSFAHGK